MTELVERLLEFANSLDYADSAALVTEAAQRIRELEGERDELKRLLNAPELYSFSKAVVLEAAHQRARWGSDHDAGKAPEDWFWLLGYLGGKALSAAKAGDQDKALHHTISSAASLANWHAAILGANTAMRPGIDPAEALSASPPRAPLSDQHSSGAQHPLPSGGVGK